MKHQTISMTRKIHLQRLGAIAQYLSNRPHSKREIIEKLRDRFDHEYSPSQIEKDLFCLKEDFDAPIMCDRKSKTYMLVSKWDFGTAILNYLAA